MKKLLLLLSFFCATQVQAQKLYSDFYLFNESKDSVLLRIKLLTDSNIKTKLSKHLAGQSSGFDNPVVIKDYSDDRRFERITLHDTTFYFRSLASGYFNLYSDKEKDRFIIISSSDTIVLQKKDRQSGQTVKVDSRYKGILNFLTLDYPEFKNIVAKTNFNDEDIQNVIARYNQKHPEVLNKKYQTRPTRDFLHFGFSGIKNNTLKHIVVDALFMRYYPGLSRNISVRTGLTGNLFDKQENNRDWVKYSYIGIPAFVNFEVTNLIFTPYAYGGPVLGRIKEEQYYYHENVYLNRNIFRFVLRAGAGIRIKPSNNLNLLAEYKWESLTNTQFVFGLELNTQMPCKKN